MERRASGLDKLGAERIGETADDVDLHLAERAALALEPVGPHMRPGRSRNELGVDLHFFAEAAHAALEHIAHTKLTPDLLGVNRLAFVGEGRAAGDDEAVLQMREVCRQIVGD